MLKQKNREDLLRSSVLDDLMYIFGALHQMLTCPLLFKRSTPKTLSHNKANQFRYALMLCSVFMFFSMTSHADKEPQKERPFYFGLAAGYGATTWQGLVPKKENQNQAITLSAPIEVREGGGVWGIFAGYELMSHFALEAAYTRYPSAHVSFDPMSLFSFDHDGKTFFSTDTELYSVMGKISLPIPKTKINIFSAAGAANVYREDIIMKNWHLSPTFGIGMTYNLSPRIMGELVGHYVAGYGESQLNPSDTYFPFLYSISFRLAYRI